MPDASLLGSMVDNFSGMVFNCKKLSNWLNSHGRRLISVSFCPPHHMHRSRKFKKNIKLGIHDDATNRDKLASILRYNSTKYSDAFISLKEYVERIRDCQKNLYYITGDGMIEVENFLIV